MSLKQKDINKNMSIPFKLYILKPSDSSTTHFDISVPEELYNAKAMILDAGGKNELIKLTEALGKVIAGNNTGEEFRTNRYVAEVASANGEKVFKIIPQSSGGFTAVQHVPVEDFRNLLTVWIQVQEEYEKDPNRYKDKYKNTVNLEEEKMVIFPEEHFKNNVLVRIYKKESELWKIEVGPWHENGFLQTYNDNFLTKEEVTMNKEDLRKLANEIKRVLGDHISEDTKLRLTFRQNKPEFRITMRYVGQDHPYYSKSIAGMFEFTPSINIKYLNRAYGREEDQYLYEDGGHHEGFVQYYKVEELEEFVRQLEQEVKD